MSAWSGGRVLLLETNVEVQAHRPPLRKSSESESGPVLNEITGSDPVIYIYLYLDDGAFQGRHITLHQFSPAPSAGPLEVNLTRFWVLG